MYVCMYVCMYKNVYCIRGRVYCNYFGGFTVVFMYVYVCMDAVYFLAKLFSCLFARSMKSTNGLIVFLLSMSVNRSCMYVCMYVCMYEEIVCNRVLKKTNL